MHYSQLLQLDQFSIVSNLIRDQIDEFDEYQKTPDQDEDSGDFTESSISEHITLGAWVNPISFQELEKAHYNDYAFIDDFWKKLAEFLNIYLPRSGISLPNDKWIHFTQEDTVCFLCII